MEIPKWKKIVGRSLWILAFVGLIAVFLVYHSRELCLPTDVVPTVALDCVKSNESFNGITAFLTAFIEVGVFVSSGWFIQYGKGFKSNVNIEDKLEPPKTIDECWKIFRKIIHAHYADGLVEETLGHETMHFGENIHEEVFVGFAESYMKKPRIYTIIMNKHKPEKNNIYLGEKKLDEESIYKKASRIVSHKNVSNLEIKTKHIKPDGTVVEHTQPVEKIEEHKEELKEDKIA